MGWTTEFYVIGLKSLNQVIGSKNNDWKKLICDNLPKKEKFLVDDIVDGNYKKLEESYSKEPLKYHLQLFEIYRTIVNLLGRELDTDAGDDCIGYRDHEDVDEWLNEKNYPSGFQLETLFNIREIPGFKDKIPIYKEGTDDGYYIFSYISPSTMTKARKIANDLADLQNKRSTKKSKKSLSMGYHEECEHKIRNDWLLNKCNIYAINKSKKYKNWKKQNELKVTSNNSSIPGNEHCYWNKLPEEVVMIIVSEVDSVVTLCRLAQVNKALNEMIMDENNDEDLWKQFRDDVAIVAFTY